MSNKYTDKMIAEMKDIGSFTYDSAKAFADEHGLSFRSVIAKVRALDLDYKAKDLKATKTSTKAKGRAKADIARSVMGLLGVSQLASLEKMTVKDLEVLEDALHAMTAVEA